MACFCQGIFQINFPVSFVNDWLFGLAQYRGGTSYSDYHIGRNVLYAAINGGSHSQTCCLMITIDTMEISGTYIWLTPTIFSARWFYRMVVEICECWLKIRIFPSPRKIFFRGNILIANKKNVILFLYTIASWTRDSDCWNPII